MLVGLVIKIPWGPILESLIIDIKQRPSGNQHRDYRGSIRLPWRISHRLLGSAVLIWGLL